MSRKCRDNVGGAFDDNFKVKVKSYIDGDDFCRAVRKCVEDIVSDDRDYNRGRDKKCCKKYWY